MSSATAPRGAAGFTLVETATVLAIAVLLAGAAWPSWQAQLAKGRRADAVSALMRVQRAQEQFRAAHGLYAMQLVQLAGAGGARSEQGLYGIELRAVGATGYVAAARALPGGAQAGDRECRELTLSVHEGFSTAGPAPHCWNR